jgi:hypothetical protein
MNTDIIHFTLKAKVVYKDEIVGFAYWFNNDVYVFIEEMYEKCKVNLNTKFTLNCKMKGNRLYIEDTDKKNYHYYRKFNKQIFKQLGFFIIPKTDQDIVNYLLNYIQNNSKYEVLYRVDSRTRIVDNTGRSLVDIVEQGYIGNRLDVMVGDYYIILSLDNIQDVIARRFYGKTEKINDYFMLLKMVGTINKKEYVDVCVIGE